MIDNSTLDIDLLFSVEEDIAQPGLSYEDVLEVVCAFCQFYHLNCPLMAEVSLVSSATISQYNAQTRSLDRPTDVLSFPLDFVEVAGEGSVSVLERVSHIQPRPHLGEVVICQEVADNQRHDFNNTLPNEMRLLLVHSLFHLVGYDHISAADAQVMQVQEDEFLTYYNQKSARLTSPLTLSSD